MQYLVQPLAPHTSFSPTYNSAGDRVFAISSANSGLALTVTNAFGPVIQSRWTEAPNQQWRFEAIGDGSFRIRNVGTGHVLDVEGAFQHNGAKVQGWEWHGGNNQRWRLTEVQAGHFRVDNVHSGMTLDVPRASREPGECTQQWSWHGGTNQLWIFSWLRPGWMSSDADMMVTAYEHPNYGGRAQVFGMGKWTLGALARKMGDNAISSVRVPQGMRITLFDEPGFQGVGRSVAHDVPNLGGVADRASSVLVDKVVTVYEHSDYQGRVSTLTVGTYANPGAFLLGNDTLSSLRVPKGMMAIVYEHDNFQGDYRTFLEDSASVGAFNDKASSVIVRALGVTIPEEAVCFGDRIQLKTFHNAWVSAEPTGLMVATAGVSQYWESFEVLRAGPSTHRTQLCFGDIVALRTFHGKLLSATAGGGTTGTATTISPAEQWQVIRAGNSSHSSFVCGADKVAFRSVAFNQHLVAESDGRLNANRGYIQTWESFGLKRVPPTVLRYGDTLSLATFHRKWLSADGAGGLNNFSEGAQDAEHFRLVRADVPTLVAEVRWGDTVALQSVHGRWVGTGAGNVARIDATSIGDAQKFQLLPSGTPLHSDFACDDDAIALRCIGNNLHMAAEADGKVNINRNYVQTWETFRLQRKPAGVLVFGQKIAMLGVHGKWLVAEGDGRLRCDRTAVGPWEQFELLRANDTNARHQVRWADRVALRSVHGKFVVAEADGNANANRAGVGATETWALVPIGPPQHEHYVTAEDRVALLSTAYNRYLLADPNGTTRSNAATAGPWESFRINPAATAVSLPALTSNAVVGMLTTGSAACPTAGVPVAASCSIAVCGTATGTSVTAGETQNPLSACLAEACGSDACGVDYCAADACGTAACGAAVTLVGACGAAAAGIAVCGADVAGVGVCGAAACGAAIAGIGACGADACAAAACAAAACGAAACGAAACGGAACGADACGAAACGVAVAAAGACGTDANLVEVRVANACAAKFTVVDLGLALACGANVCVVELCPADACGADACALDLIPIIPGI